MRKITVDKLLHPILLVKIQPVDMLIMLYKLLNSTLPTDLYSNVYSTVWLLKEVSQG